MGTGSAFLFIAPNSNGLQHFLPYWVNTWHYICTFSYICTYIIFLSSKGVEIELSLFFFTLRAAVSETRADCPTWHIWAWNMAFGKSSRSCTYILFSAPRDRNLAYFGRTSSGFRDIGLYWKFPYMHWAWNLATGKRSRSCTYTLFPP